MIQASIAALHSTAPSHEATDWLSVVALYERLFEVKPSPVVALNRAAAVAMAEDESAGLALMEPLAEVLAGINPFMPPVPSCWQEPGFAPKQPTAFERLSHSRSTRLSGATCKKRLTETEGL